jgi:hypothetical protein
MPAMLLWALLALLAVPALALAQTEAPPSDASVLVEDQTPSLDQYAALPEGEQEIQFQPESPASVTPVAETPPVTPTPTEPGTNPVPTDTDPTTPVGEEPTDPTVPVGEEPGSGNPVEEPPVGSVIDSSPDQVPVDAPVYTPPVAAFPPVDIPVAAAVPLPAEISTNPVTPAVAPPAETAVPPTAPIARPEPVSRAVTIPPSVLSPARPTAVAPKPESPFATGADLARTLTPALSVATPKQPDQLVHTAGVNADEALDDPFQVRLVSPLGSAPSGSAFFDVLAQYVMAGGSGPPTGVALILLVQIATVLGAFAWRTPRSMFQMILGVSDRPTVGYRAVALRPG